MWRGRQQNNRTIAQGSADLTPSNLTNLKCSGDYQVASRPRAFPRKPSHSPCAKHMDCVVGKWL